MSLLNSMKTFRCEKCDSSVNGSYSYIDNVLKCDCKKTTLYFTPVRMEFEFKDYVFTIEKESKEDPYSFRAHQISVEAEYGEPMFSSHNENEIIKGINDFITNSIFH